MLSAGAINPNPKIELVCSTMSTATVDGNNGLGLVVGSKANRIAMELDENVGSGWVSVRNTKWLDARAIRWLESAEPEQDVSRHEFFVRSAISKAEPIDLLTRGSEQHNSRRTRQWNQGLSAVGN